MDGLAKIRTGAAPTLGQLKRERDRYVALAFCAADLLMETDSEKIVTFAAGATMALTGSLAEDLIGLPFLDLFSSKDRLLVGELVGSMRNGSRLEPVKIKLDCGVGVSPLLVLTGYHLSDLTDSYFFAFRLGNDGHVSGFAQEHLRDPETGLLDRDSFARVAGQQMRDAKERGEDLRLTLFRMQDLTDLRPRLDQEEAND